ncbi:hypothetical protein HDV05_006937 [Chytridiales sp. JEL 0842]|nr:hypothetical protein HDV05_006937 [Chytridiales sp. JEL 0842]
MRLPLELVQLTKLRVIDLERTGLYGELPEAYSDFAQLDVTIRLAHNQLSGRLPNWTGANVEILDLRNNSFSGELPLFQNPSMKVLDLGYNQFTGVYEDRTQWLTDLRVFRINDNWLTGRFPQNLWWIDSLEIVDVSNNRMFGTVDNFSSRKLKELNLENNCLSSSDPTVSLGAQSPFHTHCKPLQQDMIPLIKPPRKQPSDFLYPETWAPPFVLPEFKGQSDCEILVWSFTQLNIRSGNQTSCCGDPRVKCNSDGRITHLLFANEKVNAKLPTIIHRFEFLRTLNLQNTGLFGILPNNFENLNNLSIIKLAHNKLSGPIPPSLTGHYGLAVVDLHDNQFSGTLARMFWDYAFLIDISNNQLRGEIPNSIGFMETVKIFKVQNNMLSGNPFVNMTQVETTEVIDFSNNRFGGEILEMKSSRLRTFNVLNNCFTGIPPTDESLGFQHPPSTCATTEDFQPFTPPPRSRPLWYTIPDNSSELREPTTQDCILLQTLFPNLKLTISTNITAIPEEASCCSDARITCNRISRITEIHLPPLSGLNTQLPAELSRLRYLQTLNMESAGLRGDIPASYAELVDLTNVNLAFNNLTGAIPSEIFSNMWNLKSLQLQGNNFTGPLPKEFTYALRFLDLGGNSFTGPIPTEWKEAEQLSDLKLSDNNLTGPLDVLQSLRGLKSVELFGNCFAPAPNLGLTTPPKPQCAPFLNGTDSKFSSGAGQIANSTLAAALGILNINATQFLGSTDTAISSGARVVSSGDVVDACTSSTISESASPSIVEIQVEPPDYYEPHYQESPPTPQTNTKLNNPQEDGDVGLLSMTVQAAPRANNTAFLERTPIPHLQHWDSLTIERALRQNNSPRVSRHVSPTAVMSGRMMQLNEKNPLDWKVEDVQVWLEVMVGVPLAIRDLFTDKYVDGPQLLGLTNEKLKVELGVEVYGERARIERHLDLLKVKWGLEMSDAGLTGSIPSSLGNLRNLQVLFLPRNSLSGSIPDIFGSLPSLQQLQLNDNQLTGTLPSSALRSWGAFDVSGNCITGPAPPGRSLGSQCGSGGGGPNPGGGGGGGVVTPPTPPTPDPPEPSMATVTTIIDGTTRSVTMLITPTPTPTSFGNSSNIANPGVVDPRQPTSDSDSNTGSGNNNSPSSPSRSNAGPAAEKGGLGTSGIVGIVGGVLAIVLCVSFYLVHAKRKRERMEMLEKKNVQQQQQQREQEGSSTLSSPSTEPTTQSAAPRGPRTTLPPVYNNEEPPAYTDDLIPPLPPSHNLPQTQLEEEEEEQEQVSLPAALDPDFPPPLVTTRLPTSSNNDAPSSPFANAPPLINPIMVETAATFSTPLAVYDSSTWLAGNNADPKSTLPTTEPAPPSSTKDTATKKKNPEKQFLTQHQQSFTSISAVVVPVSLKDIHPSTWTPSQVLTFLSSHTSIPSSVKSRFRHHAIDGPALLGLNEERLREDLEVEDGLEVLVGVLRGLRAMWNLVEPGGGRITI